MNNALALIVEATLTAVMLGLIVANATGVADILKAFGSTYSQAVGALYGVTGTARV